MLSLTSDRPVKPQRYCKYKNTENFLKFTQYTDYVIETFVSELYLKKRN